MIDLSATKTHFGIPHVPVWNCLQCGYLSDINLPLKIECGSDVPSLDSWGDQKDWRELIEPEPEESKLLLFLEDYPYTKLNPFLF